MCALPSRGGGNDGGGGGGGWIAAGPNQKKDVVSVPDVEICSSPGDSEGLKEVKRRFLLV